MSTSCLLLPTAATPALVSLQLLLLRERSAAAGAAQLAVGVDMMKPWVVVKVSVMLNADALLNTSKPCGSKGVKDSRQQAVCQGGRSQPAVNASTPPRLGQLLQHAGT